MPAIATRMLLLSLVAVACKSGDDGATTDGSTETTGTPTGTSGDPGPTTTAGDTTLAEGTSTTLVEGTSTTTAADTTAADTSAGSSTTGIDIDATAVCLAMFEDELKYETYLCECNVEKGFFPDVETCLTNNFASYSRRDCICGVYGQHMEAEPYLACVAEAAATRGACSQDLTCDDGPFDPCDDAYEDQVDDVCERNDYSDVDQDIYDECGSDFFDCDAGMSIPISWVCDGSVDCDNGKDEQDCP